MHVPVKQAITGSDNGLSFFDGKKVQRNFNEIKGILIHENAFIGNMAVILSGPRCASILYLPSLQARRLGGN